MNKTLTSSFNLLLKGMIKGMTEYRSAIVDECGEVMYWCSELEDYEIEQILEQHAEWHRTLVEW